MRFKLASYYFYFSNRQLFYYALFVGFCYFWICLPNKLFDAPYATVLLDEKGNLLNAQIAEDGQWRFPTMDSVPNKFEQAIITFEDKGFYAHWGVSIPAMFRATWQNISRGKVVSGGSTITMQIARMSRGGSRSFYNKLMEVIWAYRLEIRYPKEELLRIYATHAPFGGNVVGLEAASWRYFGISPEKLSWAEAATLAVLPNSPSLIHLGKNRALLLNKRNFLLKKLYENETIDELTYELSIEEQLPAEPKRLPSKASHLLGELVKKKGSGKRFNSTLDMDLQQRIDEVGRNFQQQNNQKEVHNMALLVIDAKTNEVKAYIGNTAEDVKFGKEVDIIQAPRSSGSILKPLLFAAMLQEGELSGEQLIPDIPMKLDGFSPKNFNNQFNGAVRAKKALAQSLNVPAVYLLKEYGIGKFLHRLQNAGQKYITRSADDYGLSLILGGAETSLWDITALYNSMSRNLSQFNIAGKYDQDSWVQPNLEKQELKKAITKDNLFDAASIYLTFQALLEVNRPEEDLGWKYYGSSKQIAWKTGTSFGSRDAWAIGCTPDYTVGVWVGNASGEGRPDIVGGRLAAPVMLEVFSRIEAKTNWYERPTVEMREMKICAESGYLASEMCEKTERVWLHQNAERGKSCNFHEFILTDEYEEYRYHKGCEPQNAVRKSKFVLPAIQSWYYRSSNAAYSPIPPYHPSCKGVQDANKPAIIYPKHNAELVLTRDLEGNQGEFVFEAAHQNPKEVLFWHLNDGYLGATETIHKQTCSPEVGSHILKVMDKSGNAVSIRFKVVDGAEL